MTQTQEQRESARRVALLAVQLRGEPVSIASADETSNIRDRIDYLASLVTQIPDVAMHPTLAQRLRLIARELLRRAG